MRISNGITNQSALNVAQPEQEPQQGVPQNTTKTGIGSSPDGFETAGFTKSVFDISQPQTPEKNQGGIPPDPTVDPSELFNYFGALSLETAPPVPPEPPEVHGTGVQSTGSEDLRAILNDPRLPFEEKMALFLFAFLDKAEKDLLKQMEQLEKTHNSQQSAGGVNGKQGTEGQGAVNGNQGAQGQGATNGPSKESEQIAMEKLKLAHEKMTKMFSTVDNILTSLHRTVKEGPIAALRS